MYRKIEEELKKWKNDYKMPLMLVGARQTGKTYILEEFCKENFDNYVYINLDKEENIAEIFEETIDPDTKIKNRYINLHGHIHNKKISDDFLKIMVKISILI